MTDFDDLDIEDPYPRKKRGYWGQFGGDREGELPVRYIQTGFGMNELDHLTLVADIAGSEKWPIAELFQRDIDHTRVEREIVPYLRQKGNFRFFNPLTVALLPVDNEDRIDRRAMTVNSEPATSFGKRSGVSYEVVGRYLLEHCQDQPAISRASWNERRVKLVAIDGQHRLSALKRLWALNSTSEDVRRLGVSDWTVPVVLVAIPELHESDQSSSSNIISAIRGIFVQINKTARAVGLARKILLEDSGTVELCTQEVLELCHGSDAVTRYSSVRAADRVPLLLFNWRGDETSTMPAALVKVEELYGLLREHLLGDELDLWLKNLQASSDESDTPLSRGLYEEITLDGQSHSVLRRRTHANIVRRRFAETMLPGLMYLLRNAYFYAGYINELAILEARYAQHTDAGIHAFDRLRYGRSREDDLIRDQVDREYRLLEAEIENIKKRIPTLMRKDVGLRSVLAAFARLKPIYDGYVGETVDWLQFAEWFVDRLNSLEAESFLSHPDATRYVAHDHENNVINYKHRDAREGLGALIALRCIANDPDLLKYACGKGREGHEATARLVDDLRKKVLNAIRTELRPRFKESIPTDTKKRNKAIDKEAKPKVAERLAELVDKKLVKLSAA